ncbi:MAG: hypothetical protein EB141_04290 [Verrucomicrobia bacterium]|nr:hypothetical protein [Verrucomicrobiota bacterium]NDB74855.1 hypothetical protein [Verrucomicrobiota bacterium]NDD37948.1 hypothetical protein [Verrucomicrobiota bacterium]NDE97811.1 hypothetical protein [Verrucomicrobiota bacterium]
MMPVDHPNLQFNYDAQGLGSCDVEMHCGEKVDEKSRKAGRIWQALMSTDEQSGKDTKPASSAKFWLKSAMVIVVVGLLLTWGWMPKGPREPEYAGRTLTQWLEHLDKHGDDPKVSDECDEAVRQIGTNALPVLLQILKAPDEPWRREVNALAERVGIDKPLVREPWFKKDLAWRGFHILGPKAQSALPELLVILSRCRTSDERYVITECISLMGPAAEAAIPALIKLGQSGGQPERYYVCGALGRIARQPEIAVPFLTDQLTYSDWRGRWFAARALGKFTTNAISATPQLIKLLDDPETQVRATATNALRLIDPAAATKAGIP